MAFNNFLLYFKRYIFFLFDLLLNLSKWFVIHYLLFSLPFFSEAEAFLYDVLYFFIPTLFRFSFHQIHTFFSVIWLYISFNIIFRCLSRGIIFEYSLFNSHSIFTCNLITVFWSWIFPLYTNVIFCYQLCVAISLRIRYFFFESFVWAFCFCPKENIFILILR